MNQFPVDVDAETVFFDNVWYTREDLAARIKSMIDQGDFAIARPSAALEELTATLQSVRTMAFRVTPDLADALNQLATRTGKTVGHLLREAAAGLVTLPHGAPPPVLTPPHHHAEEFAEPPVPVPDARVTAPTPLVTIAKFPPPLPAPAPIPPPAQAAPAPSAPPASSPSSAPVAGPGALRAAGVARDSEPTVEVGQIDARWFKQ